MIKVKFKKQWGPYNGGETAGFTAEQLAEKLNIGSGPQQQLRIPADSYELVDAPAPAAPVEAPPVVVPPVETAVVPPVETPPATTPPDASSPPVPPAA